MPSIDSLSIQITASTGSAAKKIDALTESLYYLKNAINRIDVSKFETLASVTNSLSQGLAGLKGNSVKQIEKVGKALDSMNNAAQQDSLGAVSKDVQDVADKSKEASEGVEKVSADLNNIKPASLDEMAGSFQKVSDTVKKTAGQMGTFKSILAKTKIIIPTEGLEKVNKKVASLTEKIEDLKDKMDFKSRTQADYVDSSEMEKDQKKIAELINELDRLKLKKQELESHGGFKAGAHWNFSDIEKGVKNANKHLSQFISKMVKAKSATRDTSKSTKDFSLASVKLAKELTRVTKMLKLMITRMVLRKVIQGVIDGFKNLTQYSSEVNASVSLMWNSFRQLGNSIAAAVGPLLNALAPALNYIIQLCIKVVNAINQVISALTGRSTWTKAKTLTDDYAKSLDKSNKSAKELKKTVLGFDELNQLQENKDSGGGGGTSPADMFEEAPIDDKWKGWADKLKKLFNKLIAPIKKAWDKIGDEVKKAWKRALDNVLKLSKDVARDFWKVWEQPQTQRIFENIFKIIRDIGNFVANLAKQFDIAWNKNNAGLRILEKIRDIIDIIVAGIQRITESWAEWADTIDFSPLLESTNRFLEALKQPVEAIMGMFEDLNKDFIQPLAKWLFEEGLPKLGDAFTSFMNQVDWVTLRERIDRVWKALEPFAETVGEGLIKFIDEVGDKIANFLNSEGWDSFIDSLERWTNNVDADGVANGLELICKALLGYAALSGVMAILGGVTTFLKTIAKISATVVAAFEAIHGALQNVSNFMVSPTFLTFTEFLRNPASVVSISNIVDFVKGSWLDPDEWTGWFAELYDKVFIVVNDIATVLMSPLTMINTLIEGGTMEDYANEMDKAWQSIDKYNEAIQKLKDYNLDTSGSYDDIIRRANNLQDTMGHVSIDVEKSANVMGGAAKAFKADAEKSFVGVSAGAAKLTQDIGKDTGEITISIETVEGDVANAGLAMSGTWQEMSQTFNDNATEIQSTSKELQDSFSEDKWTFSGVIDGLKNTFKDAIKGVADLWNKFVDGLNGEHSVFGKSFSIDLPRITGFAHGGFPEDDSIFMANSSEMLGKFSNGRNVVANNQQITDGIAQAVYSAIMSANGSGSAKYINNTIQIDGRTIARAVTMGQEDMNRRYSPVTT
jgi:hypothetical protein